MPQTVRYDPLENTNALTHSLHLTLPMQSAITSSTSLVAMAKLSCERARAVKGDVARACQRGVPKQRLLPTILTFCVFNAIGRALNATNTCDGVREGVKLDIMTVHI